jgi:uncharacterized protein (TIGR03437 family)
MYIRLPLFILAVSLIAHAAPPISTPARLPNSTVYAVATDSAGNEYLAGSQGTAAAPGASYAFVAKLSPAGQILYSTTFTGTGFGIAYAVAVDSSGAAYIFGNTNSPDFPVTPGALQTTMQAAGFQGFAAKVDSNGNVVYSTFIGGSSDTYPGIYTHPGLNSLFVDSAGDAILSGQTIIRVPGGTPFPPTSGAPFTSNDTDTYFVMKLDPLGGKMLAAIRGIGGDITLDSQGSIYVAGVQFGNSSSPLPVTPGAFQSEPVDVCGALGAFFECTYQYVAKLNASLTQIAYATYISGEYGASAVAISVDAEGNVFVAGNTNSPDYPTTSNALEPNYVANAPPPAPQTCLLNCVVLPPASGYLTKLNATGTGLIYSTYFSGTETDTISFAAFTANAVYLSGSAGSANLPGFGPQQCLPQMPLPQTYATVLSADATQVVVSRIITGSVLAYDAAAGMLLAWTGTNLAALAPPVPPSPIACILDSADLQPVTFIAPGELLSIFGERLSGGVSTPPPGQFPPSLGGVTVAINGVPSPLLYAGPQQINFQAPFELAGATQADIALSSTELSLPFSLTIPLVAGNPVAFLNTALSNCGLGPVPLTFNSDGSLNTCTNPAGPGSIVTVFLDGLGVTSPAQVTGAITPNPCVALNLPVVASNGLIVVSASALPGSISGVWQVYIRIPANETGASEISMSLSAGGVPVRDANLIVWVE